MFPGEICDFSKGDLHVICLGSCDTNILGLGEDAVGNENLGALLVVDRVGHCHGFSGGISFIEQGCVGIVKAGELDNHGLVIEKHF